MAEKAAPPPQMSQQMVMMLMFMMALFVLFIPEARAALGFAAGFLLEPVIGFDGQFPVLTIMLAGAIPLMISILLRHYMVDWLAMGRMTEVNRELGKQIREAMKTRNMAKMKKLQEVRMEVMREFMPVQMSQMKPTGITMLLFIMVFAWLSSVMYDPSIPERTFAVPWAFNASMVAATVLPHWLLLYSLLTLPLSLAIPRILKYISFRKKLQGMGEG